MNGTALLLLTVFVPIVGSLVLPLAGHVSRRLRNCLSLVFVLTSLVCSLLLLPEVLTKAPIVFQANFAWIGALSFTADSLAVFMAIVSSLISSIIIVYSFGYIPRYEFQNEYYAMVVLFLGAMMGIVFSSNLILLYLFWEITAIVSWRLIGFFRKSDDMVRADKAFLVTVFGAVLMLLGFIMIYNQTGSFELSIIKQALTGNTLPSAAVVLILAGILSKSATLPFHTWLPDAGVAPSPVTALLHAAVLVKIGVYVFARLFLSTFPLEEVWHTVIPLIAGTSALIAAGAAMIDIDLKRIIAYSTVSQIGFIFFGLSIGNKVGIAGGLLYILMHGLAKAGLFLCAGIVEQATHNKDITKMGGLLQTMPLTAYSFLFCALSVMGIPPFGGFFSKYMVFMGSIQRGDLFITLLFLLGAVMTIVYLFRVFNLVFLGPAKANPREGSPTMVASVVLLSLLSLGGGILIQYPSRFVQTIIRQMGL